MWSEAGGRLLVIASIASVLIVSQNSVVKTAVRWRRAVEEEICGVMGCDGLCFLFDRS